jgi:hypothetical protein
VSQTVYAADSGTANTYVANLTPAVTSLAVGLSVNVKIANASTGPSTLNVNGLGATPIVRVVSTGQSAIGPNDLEAGQIYNFKYDGTSFEVVRMPAYTATIDCGKYPNLVVGAPTGGTSAFGYSNGDLCFQEGMNIYTTYGGPSNYIGLAFILPPGVTETANGWDFPYPGETATITSTWKTPRVTIHGNGLGEFAHSSDLRLVQPITANEPGTGTGNTTLYLTGGGTTTVANTGTAIPMDVIGFPWQYESFPNEFWEDVTIDGVAVDANFQGTSGCLGIMGPREPTVYSVSCVNSMSPNYWIAVGHIATSFSQGIAPSGWRSQGLDMDAQNIFTLANSVPPTSWATIQPVLGSGATAGQIVSYNILTTGPIQTASLGSTVGSGYAVGDYGSISGGDGTAAYVIKAVSSSPAPGTPTSISLFWPGTTGYATATGVATTAITGSGSGLTLNLVGVVNASGGSYKWGNNSTLPVQFIGTGPNGTSNQPCSTMPTGAVAHISSSGHLTSISQSTNGSGCGGNIIVQVPDYAPTNIGIVFAVTDSSARNVRGNGAGNWAVGNMVGAADKYYDVHPVGTPYGIFDNGYTEWHRTECDTIIKNCFYLSFNANTVLDGITDVWLAQTGYPNQAGSGTFYFANTSITGVAIRDENCGSNLQNAGGYVHFLTSNGPLDAASGGLQKYLASSGLINVPDCTTPFTNAVITPKVTSGGITGYTINSAVNGPYTSAPTLALVGSGSGASTPTALLAGQTVVGVSGGTGGTGYSSSGNTGVSVGGIVTGKNLLVDTPVVSSVLNGVDINGKIKFSLRNAENFSTTPYLIATLDPYNSGNGSAPAVSIDLLEGVPGSPRVKQSIVLENTLTSNLVATTTSYYVSNNTIFFTGMTGLSQSFVTNRVVTLSGFTSASLAPLNGLSINVNPNGSTTTAVNLPYQIVSTCTSSSPCTDSGTLTQYPVGYQVFNIGAGSQLGNARILADTESNGSTNIYLTVGAFGVGSEEITLSQDPGITVYRNPVQQVDAGTLAFDSGNTTTYVPTDISAGAVNGTNATFTGTENVTGLLQTTQGADFGTTVLNVSLTSGGSSGYTTATCVPTTGGFGTGDCVDIVASGGVVTSCTQNTNSGGQFYAVGNVLTVAQSGSSNDATCTVNALTGQVNVGGYIFTGSGLKALGTNQALNIFATGQLFFGSENQRQWAVNGTGDLADNGAQQFTATWTSGATSITVASGTPTLVANQSWLTGDACLAPGTEITSPVSGGTFTISKPTNCAEPTAVTVFSANSVGNVGTYPANGVFGRVMQCNGTTGTNCLGPSANLVATAHQFVTSYSYSTTLGYGSFTTAQPAFSDLSGVAVVGQLPFTYSGTTTKLATVVSGGLTGSAGTPTCEDGNGNVTDSGCSRPAVSSVWSQSCSSASTATSPARCAGRVKMDNAGSIVRMDLESLTAPVGCTTSWPAYAIYDETSATTLATITQNPPAGGVCSSGWCSYQPSSGNTFAAGDVLDFRLVTTAVGCTTNNSGTTMNVQFN